MRQFVQVAVLVCLSMVATATYAQEHVLHGKVVNEAFAPMGNVQVIINGSYPVVSTPKEGRFRLAFKTEPDLDNLDVTINAGGFKLKSKRFDQAKQEVELIVQPIYKTLGGWVRTASKSPVSGAMIRFRSEDITKTAVTDRDGFFRIQLPNETPVAIADFAVEAYRVENGNLEMRAVQGENLKFVQETFVFLTVEPGAPLAEPAELTEELPTAREENKSNAPQAQNTQAQQTQTESESRQLVSPMMKLIAKRRGKEALEGGEEEAVRREIAATAVELGRLQNQITAALTAQDRKLAEAAFQAYINEEATKNFLALLRERDPGNPLFIILEKYERENQEILEAKKATETQLDQLKRYFTAGLFSIGTLLLLIGIAVYFAVSNHRKTKQLQAATQQLEAEQERLKALNNELKTLTEIVAHDLKAPLNKVVGLTQLLPLVGTLNEEQSKYMGMVNQVAHDGRQFIENLLDVKAIEEQKRCLNNAPLEVVEWLNRSLAGYEQTANRKNITVHLEHTGQSWIEVDKSAFGQVLDNLVSNAIKFSPPDRNIYIRVETGYSLISIAIRDQGPGISEEDQQKMFKKFQRLSARPTAGEHSSGLGLSIVKLLVEQMNGEIHLDSEVGRGSTFTVYFHKHVPEVPMTQETAA